ncbi:unnamed protein product, partial [Gongylonema pulchrum]|uniref:G_PROTEIN_RECEP_F1_2 domain-containing protein n=1 Tax=Gongylonema pulchrum TaxID=637853 RepID=A0A183EA46_9BILA
PNRSIFCNCCSTECVKSDYFTTALRNIYYLGSVVLVLSTFFLSIERVIAALLYRSYEHNTRRWIGILLIFLQVIKFLFSWLLVAPFLYYQQLQREQQHGSIAYPYCSYWLFNAKTTMSIYFALIVFQSCSFTVIIVLWTHNNKKVVRLNSYFVRIWEIAKKFFAKNFFK